MDHSLGTLGPSRLAFIPHVNLRALTRRYPGLAAAFWRNTLIDGATFREWMVNLGRRTGQQRVAHLLCEMAARYRAVGLTNGQAFEFPITQTELGDAVGLTPVHVNRVLQDLRQAPCSPCVFR